MTRELAMQTGAVDPREARVALLLTTLGLVLSLVGAVLLAEPAAYAVVALPAAALAAVLYRTRQ
jgi:hypothetical protein